MMVSSFFIWFCLLEGEGFFVPPLVDSDEGVDEDVPHVVRFDGEAERFFLTLRRELGGEAEGLHHALVHFDSVEEVGDFWNEFDSARRVEASIVRSLVFDVQRILYPLTPRQTCVLGRQAAILALFLHQTDVVVLDAAANHDARDLGDPVAAMSLLRFERLVDDDCEVRAFASLHDCLDVLDVHTFLFAVFRRLPFFDGLALLPIVV